MFSSVCERDPAVLSVNRLIRNWSGLFLGSSIEEFDL